MNEDFELERVLAMSAREARANAAMSRTQKYLKSSLDCKPKPPPLSKEEINAVRRRMACEKDIMSSRHSERIEKLGKLNTAIFDRIAVAQNMRPNIGSILSSEEESYVMSGDNLYNDGDSTDTIVQKVMISYDINAKLKNAISNI